MHITKLGHACVTLTEDERRLVIDPGVLSDPQALKDASAVLVTHEHLDHFAEGPLREAAASRPDLEIWTNASVARQLDGLGGRVHVVGEGDEFTAAGFDVRVYGTWHALIHPDVPAMANIGFLVDGTLFHPGDALTVPDQPVDTLMLPVHAPWSATRDLIDWVREVRPRQAFAIHDGALNDAGTTMLGALLGEHGPGIGAPYTRLATGESATLG